MKLAIIVTVPDNRPIKSTLGRALKTMLRRHGLRCIDLREITEQSPPPPADAEPPSDESEVL